jgi:hypothetical protein
MATSVLSIRTSYSVSGHMAKIRSIRVKISVTSAINGYLAIGPYLLTRKRWYCTVTCPSGEQGKLSLRSKRGILVMFSQSSLSPSFYPIELQKSGDIRAPAVLVFL